MTPEMHRIALKSPKKALAHPFGAQKKGLLHSAVQQSLRGYKGLRGSGQQDASAAQGTMRMLGAATRTRRIFQIVPRKAAAYFI